MKKIISLAYLLALGLFLSAQNTMNVYLENGTVFSVPINLIDSVNHTLGFSGIISYPGNGVVDADGNNYSTIVYGNGQEWMNSNLNVSVYRNGDNIPTTTQNPQWSNTTSGLMAEYNHDSNNSDIYGKLYNWYVVNDGRGVCPMGWKVPTENDFNILLNYLDPSANGNSNIAGGKMKKVGTLQAGNGFWSTPNTSATNEANFSALPGGYRITNGTFSFLNQYAYWWTSTEVSTIESIFFRVDYDNAALNNNFSQENSGFSIRCLKD